MWANQDLNLGPTGYEPAALTTELLALVKPLKTAFIANPY